MSSTSMNINPPARRATVSFAASARIPMNRRPTALASYNSLLAGGDNEKMVLLQKKDAALRFLMNKVLKEHEQQKLAAIHYSALNNYILFLPAIMITFVSAIIGIFLTSALVDGDNAKVWLAITISILQLFLALFQTVGKQLNFSAKAGFHLTAAAALRKMYDESQYFKEKDRYKNIYKALKTGTRLSIGADLSDGIVKDFAKLVDGDEDSHDDDAWGEKKGDEENQIPLETLGGGAPKSDDDDDEREHEEKTGKEQIDDVSRQFSTSVDHANNPIPLQLHLAYSMLDTRITIINKSLIRDKSSSIVSLEKVEPALYIQLTETIVQHPLWPIVIPNPKWAVNKALRDFKKILRVDKDNDADILSEIIKRGDRIEQLKYEVIGHARKSHYVASGRTTAPDLDKTQQSDCTSDL